MSVRREWELMVDEGLLVPTGEMRPDSTGKLQPVYVLSERAKILHAVMLRELWDGVLPDVADL